MVRVDVNPRLLRWACERSGIALEQLERRFRPLPQWLSQETKPTLKQLEKFAQATYTPVGYFFLQEPPDDALPIADLRTVGSQGLARPSAALLDVVHACQRRQAWYHDHLRSLRTPPLAFVGSVRVGDDADAVAAAIRRELRFDLAARASLPSWEEALRRFVAEAEEAGILVMRSGVVGNNTHRPLDPQEFRGFALADELAPLVFINAADTKAAQMFTLAHEVAHLWLGQSAVTDVGLASETVQVTERWCNRVAAEVLVPLQSLRDALQRQAPPRKEASRLARVFKVSTLVVLRRMRDAGVLSRPQFQEAYDAELARLKQITRTGEGGSFYRTQMTRFSPTFQRALYASTLEGETLFRDALQLLDLSRMETFRQLGATLGLSA